MGSTPPRPLGFTSSDCPAAATVLLSPHDVGVG
jgi:hypothetical protein